MCRVKKKQIFNKNLRTLDKTEKKTDLVKKTAVATLVITLAYHAAMKITCA